MQLLEEDKPAFKQWLLPKLASLCDAEPTVLAEYVAELFGNAGSKEEIKHAAVEQLSDFLDNHTQTFVDEVAANIEQKSWIAPVAGDVEMQDGGSGAVEEPRHAQQAATPPTGPKAATKAFASSLSANAPAFVPRGPVFSPGVPALLNNDPSIPKGPRADRLKGAQNAQAKTHKKRKLHERETSRPGTSGSEYAADSSAGERPHKQVARRGGGNIGRSGPRGISATGAPFTPDVFGNPADPMNPFNFLANMSAMMSMAMQGQADARAPSFTMPGRTRPKIKCRDYESKGICKMGTLCPYDHGGAVIKPRDPEYDPNNSALGMQPHLNGRPTSSYHREGNRAPFSHGSPSHDSNDTVVFESIPEDHFTEQHVRDFLSQFGAIVDVQLQNYKRRAIVKFSDHPAAQRAHDSPKAIFDNRFVKVYWYKPEPALRGNGANGTNGTAMQAFAQSGIPEIYREMENEEHYFDVDAFNEHQALVQKEFEERRRKGEEAEARSRVLNAQIRAKDEEIAKTKAVFIEKARAKGIKAIIEKEQQAPAIDLAELQTQAAGLFANAENKPAPNAGRGGLSNGRGSSLGGRGGVKGSVKRLDNRPRRLAVARIEAGSAKEGALKRYLLNVKGLVSVQPHSELVDTLVLGFEQRYQAESFLKEATRIPNVSIAHGDLSWVPNDATVAQQSIETDDSMVLDHDMDNEVLDGQAEPKVEVDLDVADDTDYWKK